MKRFKFVMNQAISEDFMSMCKSRGIAKAYTRIDNVSGVGLQGPCMGDDVWPQWNTMFIIVDDDSTEESYRAVVDSIRKEFPNDGLFCNFSNCELF